jgi:HPt (histidine-containing phosphotransfer) domain-containing protein
MDPEDFRESAELFVALAPGTARELRALARSGDTERLRMLAHRLIGTLGFFDPEAAAPAVRVESAIADGRLHELPELVSALERALIRVAHSLEHQRRADSNGDSGGQRS